MKVKIERKFEDKKTGGMFSKKTIPCHKLYLEVIFSDEELAVIKQANLGKYQLFERPWHPEAFGAGSAEYWQDNPLRFKRVSDLVAVQKEPLPDYMDRPIAIYSDQASAIAGEEELKDKLRGLKGLIDKSNRPAESAAEFEL